MQTEQTLLIAQVALCAVGSVLAIRRLKLERARRASGAADPLPLWDVDVYAFGFAVLRVVTVTLGVQFAVTAALKAWVPTLVLTEGLGFLIVGGASQVGMLVGLGVALFFLPRSLPPPPWEEKPALPARLPVRGIPLAALETFLITGAAVSGLTLAWRYLLGVFGVAAPEQDMVELLRHSPTLLEPSIIVGLACVLAPFTEEALFRGGVFRFCRGRFPLVISYVMPAVLFSLVHFSLNAFPGLILFGVIMAFAYARTGRIAVPMIAHALFNLQTLLVTLLERGP
ncbi:lysostaphin resistance A-like protein [Nibricoccus sp. IMCC34717]|uniref:CPBP family intramembrane glutamic endopeptidase n=1 Tax=Nibricoccus sp. IMCC34717 TaxID=3034021 RepID=UPI00384CCB66